MVIGILQQLAMVADALWRPGKACVSHTVDDFGGGCGHPGMHDNVALDRFLGPFSPSSFISPLLTDSNSSSSSSCATA